MQAVESLESKYLFLSKQRKLPDEIKDRVGKVVEDFISTVGAYISSKILRSQPSEMNTWERDGLYSDRILLRYS